MNSLMYNVACLTLLQWQASIAMTMLVTMAVRITATPAATAPTISAGNSVEM